MTYKEIQNIAEKLKMEESVIDKDWLLGHFLNAMFSFPDISKNFVFKGATCLRKNYFENYRFSEDLDFTLLDEALAIDELFFKKIIRLAEHNSGAKFHLKNIKPQIHKDMPQGYEATILFWGAFHKPNQPILPVNRWQTKIKLDISFSEKVLLKPEMKNINCCNYDDFINQKKHRNNKRAWESSLAYHLPQGQLVDYDKAFSKVEQFVMNILNQTI